MDTTLTMTSPVNTRSILTVSQLNRFIASTLERNLPLAWVKGEISNFTRASSGHWYFSLKDAQAQIRCVMFRGRNQYADWLPKEGEAVEVRALVGLYEARGDLQLTVEAIRRSGQGNLFEAFVRLKEKLGAEGLFAQEKKKALPAYPRAIGIITSLQAAALKDVLTAFARRAPQLKLIIYPAPVQGQDAAKKLAEQVTLANRRREVDVLILIRGGGSIEDLWAFNEEILARAIAASDLPVVSGVGHETDFTIADFVADLRAPTPTAAAELVSLEREQLLNAIASQRHRLKKQWQRVFERNLQTLDHLTQRLVSPQARLQTQRMALAQLNLRLGYAFHTPLSKQKQKLQQKTLRWQQLRPNWERERQNIQYLAERNQIIFYQSLSQRQLHLNHLKENLKILSPQHTLERGYAVLLTQEGKELKAVRSPQQIQAQQTLSVHLAQGRASIVLAAVQTELENSAKK